MVEGNQVETTQLEFLSTTVTSIIYELAQDEMLCKLILNNVAEPFIPSLPPKFEKRIITPNDEYYRISPTPFNPNAQDKEESFIRVYYNQGAFDSSEVILEPQLFIDIIVSKSLWLIHNKEMNKSLIRPYEIMGRIIDRVGRRGMNGKAIMKFSGFQHLAVNTEFDAIRLYCDSFNIRG